MSRVRVYLGCSLDGCIAGPDHDLSFLEEFVPGPDSEASGALGFQKFIDQIGALLMGRRTYQVLLDHDAWHYGDRQVFVATHHALPPAPQGGKASALQGSIEELVTAAKAVANGKDVYLDGGDLVRQGLDAGLVDELCLTVLPVILGRGVRLWDGLINRNDLEFEPPIAYGNAVQLTGRIVLRSPPARP